MVVNFELNGQYFMADPGKGQRVVQAFLKMKKMDIEALENA